MGFETDSNKNLNKQDRDAVDPRINKDGTIWYQDKTGKVMKLDESGDAEFNSQQRGNPPSPGWPEFSKRTAFEDIPESAETVVKQTQGQKQTFGTVADAEARFFTPEEAARINGPKSSDVETLLGQLAQSATSTDENQHYANAMERAIAQSVVIDKLRALEEDGTSIAYTAPLASRAMEAKTPAEMQAIVQEIVGLRAGLSSGSQRSTEQSSSATTELPQLDERNFQLNISGDRARGGGADTEEPYYHYRLPDGTFLKNPDGSDRRFTQDEYIAAGDRSRVTPEEIEIARASYEGRNEGPRATEVARDRSGGGGGGIEGIARDWAEAPRLLKGAKALRQSEIQADTELERNFLLVVEGLDKNKGADIYARWVNKEELKGPDYLFLKYARVEFANRFAAGEMLQKKLEGKAGLTDLRIVKRRNEEFSAEVEFSTDEKALALIRGQAMIPCDENAEVRTR